MDGVQRWCDKVCQWLATGLWFSPGPPVSSTNKTDRHDITEILMKLSFFSITKQTKNQSKWALINFVIIIVECKLYINEILWKI
jgi:hypothetical protein